MRIESLIVPLPPLAEQHRIVAKIEELLPLIDKYDKAYTKLTDFNTRFPEAMKKSLLQYAIQGKLNFYLTAVDNILKTEQDAPTIGLLLCKGKNDLIAEYALQDINKPIGVSEYRITEDIPEKFRQQLPSIEDIKNRISKPENHKNV